jgi:hypothetical protein
MNILNKNIIWLLIIIYLSPAFVFAQNNRCSNSGYTILTINGINTQIEGAIENRDRLQRKLSLSTFNSQPVTVDFIYNPTHALQTDLVDAIYQKYFEQRSYNLEDSDFAHMLIDASDKVTTQKVLLVAHSQGNFYANTFYNAVADEDGGVPSQSIGVYGVASPASSVAGGGEYLTSDTDKVIAGVVAKFPYTNILKPNTHIELTPSDGNGHSFSDVYLKYRGDKIKGDIENALSRLKNNNVQTENSLCINPPKLTIAQKIQGTTLTVIDSTVFFYNSATSFVGQKYLALVDGAGKLFAGLFGAYPNINTSAVVLSDAGNNSNQDNQNTSTPQAEATPPTVEAKEKSTPALVINTDIEPNIPTPTTPITTTTPNISTPHLFVNNNITSGGGGGGANTVTVEAPVIPEPTPVVVDPVIPPPVADTIPPVITLVGDTEMTIPINSIYTELGAGAVDDVDGNISVTTTGEVDTSTSQIYNISYTATDVAGNTATKIRRVSVDSGAKLFHPNQVFVSENYAYVVSESNALEILDIRNPATPLHKSFITNGTDGAMLVSPSSVFVSGGYAYITSTLGNALEIIDVSDPLHPVHKATFVNGDDGARFVNPNSVIISQNYAYISARGSQNVEILDITDPVHPLHKGSYGVGALNVPGSMYISDNYLYLTVSCLCSGGGSVQVVDISDPAHPALYGQIIDGADGINLFYPTAVFVSGNYIYETTSSDPHSMNIIDVSDQTNLVYKGVVHDGDGGAVLTSPNSIVVSLNYAYVSSFTGSALDIIDISDPTHPVYTGKLVDGDGGALLSYPKNVFVKDSYAYIASQQSSALEIIDISDPSHPTHAGKIIDGGF